MKDFFEVPASSVLMQGVNRVSGFHDIHYIVYASPTDTRWNIRINAYFTPLGSTYKLCTYYDRPLCHTLEEFQCIPVGRIESQAYGAWMDGAR